jgi:hypothetical protein
LQPHPIAPLFGFDRLRFAGFSAEDIEEIRQQFHRWRRPTTRDIEATQNQNRRQRHLLEAEEQWLEHAQLNQSPVMDLEGGAASDDDNNNYEDGDDFNASNRNTIRNDNDEITNIENNNSSSRNNSRAQYEVLLGVVMGFFMTWQILMLMGEKHLFSSYRIQIGIAFGILFNLTFTLLHQIVHG